MCAAVLQEFEANRRMTAKRIAPKANSRALADPVGKDTHVTQNSKRASRRRSRLTPNELEEFQVRLLDKRGELIGDVRGLQSEAVNGNGRGGGGSNAMPIHMAERASDTWEQALTLRLSEAHASIVHKIDAAVRAEEAKGLPNRSVEYGAI